MDVEAKKRAAALAACKHVRSGMQVGLGTGSTVQFVLEELARRHQAGETFTAVATSRRTEEACRALGLGLSTLAQTPRLDLTIDGADELDAHLNLIKGGGGALLREKVVAAASDRLFIIADDAKVVAKLGSTFAVPVEVAEFALDPVRRRIEALGAAVVTRAKDGAVFKTDNGNPILDARFQGIDDPARLERTLKMMPGVLEVGLFCGMAQRAFVGTHGGVHEIAAPGPVSKAR